MPQTPHILRSYDEALSALESEVSAIADQARANLLKATDGFLRQDEAACLQAIADDETVNAMERAIDAAGIDIMTRYQPVARDLRKVLASMRIANNIERVSDEAKNIGRRARSLTRSGFAGGKDLLAPLFQMALEEFDESVRAFLNADLEKAGTIRPNDKELDQRYREALSVLSDRLAAGSEAAKDYLNLLFIARSVERIGDHAKNIAEETVFLYSR